MARVYEPKTPEGAPVTQEWLNEHSEFMLQVLEAYLKNARKALDEGTAPAVVPMRYGFQLFKNTMELHSKIVHGLDVLGYKVPSDEYIAEVITPFIFDWASHHDARVYSRMLYRFVRIHTSDSCRDAYWRSGIKMEEGDYIDMLQGCVETALQVATEKLKAAGFQV